MSFVLRSLMIFGAITVSVHSLAEGQLFQRPGGHGCCNTCQQPQCVCVQPVPAPAACVPPPTQSVGGPVAQSCTKTCTTVHPVVETSYRQENFMTYRNECRTALRQEAYCEQVPTTQVENITRDEGCYQMVWVPKPVTRQYAKTVYQQRTAYRNVPYQYTVQVPQMNTRVVPQQSVRYVQKTQTFTQPMQQICPPAQPVFAQPVPQAAALPAPMIAPSCAVPVSAPSCAAPGIVPASASVTPPTHGGTHWTQFAQQQSPQQPPQQIAQQPAVPSRSHGSNYMAISSHPKQYSPVQQAAASTPSAASVWQSRR